MSIMMRYSVFRRGVKSVAIPCFADCISATHVCASKSSRAILRSTNNRTASTFCQYDETSSTYDMARYPLDVDDLISRIDALAALKQCDVTDLRLLDVGAGSGNYYDALRGRSCFIQYHGLDGSQGMINQFKAKESAKEESIRGTFSLQRCNLKELPLDLEDDSFDVVMITQVLHHLSDGTDEHRPVFDLMREIGRVTNSDGGFLWCQTQTQEQHTDGFWWSEITPAASATLAARFPPMEKFIESLASFSAVETHVPEDPLMRKDIYLDIERAYTLEYRNCDSNWSLVTPEDLEAGLAKLRAIIDGGMKEKFIEQREARRREVGQTTTVVAMMT